MADTKIEELAKRVESEPLNWTMAEEIFAACLPEPDRGPWYWRSTKWRKWDHIRWHVTKALRDPRGDLLFAVGWLYRGELPEMIHTDRTKAIAHALRAKGADNAG